MGTNDGQRQVYVLNKGKPTPLPDGVLMIVPTKFKPFVVSPLISPWGKLRMGMDLFIPPRRDGGDETLADFVRRRLGSEALDKIAEPLMSGIYNAEADKQSLLATFPRFRELETQLRQPHQGNDRLAQARVRTAQDRHRRPATAGQSRPSSRSAAAVNELVDALVANLTGDLRLNAAVDRIESPRQRLPAGAVRRQSLQADAVILATPAFASAELLRPFAPDAADLLAGIRYVSTGTISLAFDSDRGRPIRSRASAWSFHQ